MSSQNQTQHLKPDPTPFLMLTLDLVLPGRLALRRAAANLPWVDVLPQEGANVYSILQRDILVRQGCRC